MPPPVTTRNAAAGSDHRPLGYRPNCPTPRLDTANGQRLHCLSDFRVRLTSTLWLQPRNRPRRDWVVAELRARQLEAATEQAYVGWIKRYPQFCDHQHPARLNQRHLAAFLRTLTENKTDIQKREEALAAVVFLYRHVLPGSFPWLTAFAPKKARPKRASPSMKSQAVGAFRQAVADSEKTKAPTDILERIHRAIRVRNMARETEKIYVNWARRFLLFHNNRHPLAMGKQEVSAFLTHLAVDDDVAGSTQNQALAALLFLYREVLERDFGWLDDVVRAKKPKRIPVVFTADEAEAIIRELNGVRWLMGMMMYGGGLRVSDCVRQRVKDLDFDRLEIIVRSGKGAKDRVTLLPKAVVAPLKDHLQQVRSQHERAMEAGYGGVELPYALARKYPNAQFEWGWQYVFPAPRPSRDPRSGAYRRHHLDPSYIQKPVRAAIRKLGINEHARCHTFRHTFATELLASGTDIRTVQELMGHKDVRTTQIYTHVLRQNSYAVRSPADRIATETSQGSALPEPVNAQPKRTKRPRNDDKSF